MVRAPTLPETSAPLSSTSENWSHENDTMISSGVFNALKTTSGTSNNKTNCHQGEDLKEAQMKSDDALTNERDLNPRKHVEDDSSRSPGRSDQPQTVTNCKDLKTDDTIVVETENISNMLPTQIVSPIMIDVPQSQQSMSNQIIRTAQQQVPILSTPMCQHQRHGPIHHHHHVFSGYAYSIPLGPHGAENAWPVIEAPVNMDANPELRHFCPAHPQGPANREHCAVLQLDGDVSVPLQITNKGKIFRGPATVQMISQGRTPSMAVPVQVPQSQVMQQIVNENGTLTHVVLSPCPPLPGQGGIPHIHTSFINSSNAMPQFYNPFSASGNTSHFHSVPGSHSIQPQQIPHTNQPILSPCQKDERAAKLQAKLLKKLEKREIKSTMSTPTHSPSSRKAVVNGNVRVAESSASSVGTSEDVGELNTADDEDESHLMTEFLSTVQTPEVTDITSRSAMLRWGPPPPTQGLNINHKNLRYFVLLSDRGNEGKYKVIFKGNSFVCMIQDLRPGQEYFVCLQATYDKLEGFASEPAVFKTPPCEPDQPSPVKLFSRTKNSLQLRWSAPADNGSHITHYALEYDEGKGKGFKEVAQTKGKQYTLTKLQSATNYSFRISAVNGVGKSMFSNVAVFSTSNNPPPTPRSPNLLSVSSNSLHLTWDRRMSDEEYVLQMCNKDSGYGFLTVYCGHDTHYECRDLKRATAYQFRLRAENDTGQSAWANEVVFKTLPERPGRPSKPQAKGKIHGTSFKVRWDPPIDRGGAEIKNYFLEISSGAKFECVYSGSEPEAVCDRLQPGTTYQVRVSCEGPAGISEYSDIVAVTTEAVVPGEVEPPYFINPPGPYGAVLKWDKPDYDGGASILKYELLLNGPNHDNAILTNGKELYCVVKDLCPGESYEASVRAINRIGPGGWSEALALTTPAAPPYAPALIEIQVQSAFHVTVSWTEPISNGSPIISYCLENSKTDDSTDQFSVCYQGIETSVNLQNLTPFTLYYFRVCAINEAGSSPFSNVLSLQTPASVPFPPHFETYEVTASEVKLNWSEPNANGSPILHYNIEYGDQLICTESNSKEYRITGLIPETSYRFKIQAVNAIGSSQFSASIKISTLPPPPEPPKLECSGVGHNFIKLKWGEGRNIDYTLYYVEMLNNRTKEFQTVYKGTNFMCKVNKLQEQQSYIFRICAETDNAGVGNYSPEYSFATNAALPNTIKAPRIIEMPANSTQVYVDNSNLLTNRSGSANLTGNLTIEWQHSKNTFSDTIEYILHHASGKEIDYEEIYRGEDTHVTVCNLDTELTHFFRVSPVRITSTGDHLFGVFSNALKVQLVHHRKSIENIEIATIPQASNSNVAHRNRLSSPINYCLAHASELTSSSEVPNHNVQLSRSSSTSTSGNSSKRFTTKLSSLYSIRRRFTDQEKAILWMIFFIVVTVAFAVLVRMFTR